MTARPSGAARAGPELNRGLILASAEIEAPPERVFAALTTSEQTQWWGSPNSYRITKFTADLRNGGAWRSDGVSADGKPFSVRGEIIEIEPPRGLVQTRSDDWGAPTIRYQIDPTPVGSRVPVWHEGFGDQTQSCEDHALGWEEVLGWLSDHFPRAAP